jgi:hypothetical protein
MLFAIFAGVVLIGFIVSLLNGNGLAPAPSSQLPAPANNHKDGDTGTGSTIDLTAQVRFTETQITIHNGDTFDWTNVKLEINAGVFSSGFVLKAPRIGAGQDYVAEAMQFAKSNGERFNPFTYKLQSFDIWCDTPNGQGAYFGKSN